MPRQTSRDGVEPQQAVRNMKKQETARRQMTPVDVAAFGGEEMHRYRVARESIHCYHVEIPCVTGRQFALHLHPCVAEHRLNLGLGVLEKSEPFMRNVEHFGVDLVKAKCIAGPAPSRDGPGAQSHDCHAPGSTAERV